MTRRRNVNNQPAAKNLLDSLPQYSVVLDKYGFAWQSGRIYWYRTGEEEPFTSWDLAFSFPITTIHTPTTEGNHHA